MAARIAMGHQGTGDGHHAASSPHTAFGNVTWNFVFSNVSDSVHKRSDSRIVRVGERSDRFNDLDFAIRQILETYRFLMGLVTNNIEARPVDDAFKYFFNYPFHIGTL